MARTYFVLVARHDAASCWGVEFGSWVRDEVAFERDELKRAWALRASDLKIIACDGRQAAIDAKVAKLNAIAGDVVEGEG